MGTQDPLLLDCWQFKRCGREAGGSRARELGVCPAATERRADGLNGGTNGGRCCWAISGTLCGGTVQGTFAAKVGTCLACDFYARVHTEQGRTAARFEQIRDRLR